MKKFQNILIASDVDGTILWDYNYIHPDNFKKLRYFCDNGGHFALSTGRSHKDIFIVAHPLEQYINMPCILCNGTYLYDHISNQILNPFFLDPLPLIEAFQFVKERYPEVGMRATAPKGFLCPKEDDIAIKFLEKSGLAHLTQRLPIKEFENEKLFKSVFTSADTQKLLLLQEELREKYGAFYDIMLSGKTILEILPKGISKKTQFPYLKTIYPGTELWCIGDFHNDLEMLEGADVAVCPENAVDEIKAICELQVCHCKDGALADMIDRIEQRIDSQNSSEK